MSAPVVIIGTGLAGYNLAKEWRKLDTQTPLLLITADDGRSYSKPMLSTGFGKNKDAEEHAQQAAPAAAQLQTAGTVDLTKPPTFVPLDAFTVNLRRDEGDHYLQVVAVLRLADATMDPTLKAFMPEIRHRINLLLSSKLPSEIATIEGRQALALIITEQINEALGFKPMRDAAGQPVPNGPVQSVLFTSFIIQ